MTTSRPRRARRSNAGRASTISIAVVIGLAALLVLLSFMLMRTGVLSSSGLASAPRSNPTIAPIDTPRPPRVVALSPALAAIAVDLGFDPMIVGRHGWDIVLDPALPVCGDQSGIDYEALLATDPTHIYLQWGSREPPARLVSLADRRGWMVRTLDPLTLTDIARAARVMLADLDDQRSADPNGLTVAGRRLELFETFASGSGAHTTYPGTVLLLASVDPPAALGPGSFHHEMLLAIGGTPAVTNGTPWIEMDAEDLIALEPDAVAIFAASSPGAPGGAADETALIEPLRALRLRAVESGRVIVLDGPEVLLPSTRLMDLADRLRRRLDAMIPG